MICGSSKCQKKLRMRKLEKQGVFIHDRQHDVHGRWTDDGFVPSKGKVRK